MGIVNVTPDSFFPESRTASCDAALARGREHFARGADVDGVAPGGEERPAAGHGVARAQGARLGIERVGGDVHDAEDTRG